MRVVVLALAFGLTSSAMAVTKHMTVVNAWLRAAPPTSDVTAAYLDIANLTDQDDELIKISSDKAQIIEIHETKISGDQSTMVELKTLKIAKDQKVSFAPGSFHLMVMGLKKPLKVGEEIPLKLEFKNHASVTVKAEVR